MTAAAEQRAGAVLRLRASTALARTHDVGGRGPRTIRARQLLADWLEGRAPATGRDVEASIKWLRAVAETEAER